MRKVVSAFFAMLFLIAGSASVAMAQQSTPESPAAAPSDAQTAYAPGLNQGAAYIDDRGDVVAVVSVTAVERGWKDYDEYDEPDRGYEYVLVSIKVDVVGADALSVDPYSFSMLDSLGLNSRTAYASPKDGSQTVVLEDETPVSAGASLETNLVFSIYKDANPGFLMWQPDSGWIVMVNLQA